ncbi:Gibberellin 20 oxidase 5 [Colletotrichum siamense]|nr:Gibberellin 20 oxidase 5 [Colletotrichum siamense]
MPTSNESAAISKWNAPEPTKENLDYVELIDLDLSKFEHLETKKELAKDLLQAVALHGFFTISNHGISTKLWDHQMDVANAVMTLSNEEKRPYEGTPEEDQKGIYVGFKPSGELGTKGGFHKEVDHYNMLLHDFETRPHPQIISPFKEEIRHLMQTLNDDIHRKLLILVAMVLQVPEQLVLDMHRPGGSTTNYFRYMSYSPRNDADREKSRDLFLPGHADWSTFSILFSQPISALQILDNHNQWKWVRYIPHTLIVNVGEALEFLTGRLFKATIHRVVTPPVDQRQKLRIGILFFTRPNDDKLLVPIAESPYLQKLGLDTSQETEVFKTNEYLQAKKRGYKTKELEYNFDRPKDATKHVDPFSDYDPLDLKKHRVDGVVAQQVVSM